MKQIRILASVLAAVLVLLCGCDSEADRSARFSSLSASQHKDVMDLLKKIYETGIGDHIVAWYETTARGYFDAATGKMISFDKPVQTLSVAIPDFITATTDVGEQLKGAAQSASHKGWRLGEFRVSVEPHGAGGGPSGSYDKVTIYPLTVTKADRAADQSRSKKAQTTKGTASPELLAATRKGNVAAMRKFLDSGADPNGQVDGDTPLVIAATRGAAEPVTLLLEAGAKVDGRDAIGTTPLFAATINGNEEVVAILIAKRADVDARLPNGVTAMDMAQMKGYTRIVSLLREASRK